MERYKTICRSSKQVILNTVLHFVNAVNKTREFHDLTRPKWKWKEKKTEIKFLAHAKMKLESLNAIEPIDYNVFVLMFMFIHSAPNVNITSSNVMKWRKHQMLQYSTFPDCFYPWSVFRFFSFVRSFVGFDLLPFFCSVVDGSFVFRARQ